MTSRHRPGPGGARRTIAVVVLGLAAAGCLRQDTDAGIILRQSPPPTTASPVAPGVYKVGQTGVTAIGNLVTVYSFEGSLPSDRASIVLGAADVEACASRTGGATVDPRRFELEFSDLTRRPYVTNGPKTPLLERTELSLGRCARGWIHFEYRADERPAAVVLQSETSSVRWRIS